MLFQEHLMLQVSFSCVKIEVTLVLITSRDRYYVGCVSLLWSVICVTAADCHACTTSGTARTRHRAP